MYHELGNEEQVLQTNNDYSILMWLFYFVIFLYMSMILPDILFLFTPKHFLKYKNVIVQILVEINFLISSFLLCHFSKISFKRITKFRKVQLSFIYAVFASFFISFSLIVSKKCDESETMQLSKFHICLLTILTPICEEFLFRGWLLNFVGKSLGKIKSIFITSLLFAFVHQRIEIGEKIIIFIISLWWCYITYTTNTIYTTIFLHFIQNLLVSLNILYPKTICGVHFVPFLFLFLVGSIFCFIYQRMTSTTIFEETTPIDTSCLLENDIFGDERIYSSSESKSYEEESNEEEKETV